MTEMPVRLGVDVGGTFTDVILVSQDGSMWQAKVPSTPPDFSRAVLEAVETVITQSGMSAMRVRSILHGTTVATNAILERRGSLTGLITTRGFRDVLELGRLRHPSLYDLSWEKPTPLVPRWLRAEVDERVGATGVELRTLDLDQVIAVATGMRSAGVRSIAVCFLHSYLNPEHEERATAAIRAAFPDLYVTASADLVPEIKEFERTSTAVVNAYVQPTIDGYLGSLESGLRAGGIEAELLVMQSSGGLLEATEARARPVQLIESGPAAGVIGASFLARRIGLLDAITLDMGGTTAKAALVEGGKPLEVPELEVAGRMNNRRGLTSGAGYAIRTTAIDLAEIGAGGGSVFWIDPGGAPHVGPRSAGALPGPACYGRGGEAATVTDANVVLGYFNPVELAGGAQLIDRELAAHAIKIQAAGPLRLSVEDAAFGVHTIAVSNMSKAVRSVTIERGRDPRQYVLVSFGGAGPAHASAMASEFGISTVLVPRNPGLFSTMGLLVADVRRDYVQSYRGRDAIDPTVLNDAFSQLEMRAASDFGSRRNGQTVRLDRFADVRYVGQSADLKVAVAPGRLAEPQLRELRSHFDLQHKRTYGHASSEQTMEIVSIRLHASLPNAEAAHFAGRPPDHGDLSIFSERGVYFSHNLGWISTPVISRWHLDGQRSAGPLIVEEMDSSTVIPPGWLVHRDDLDNLVLERPRT